MFNWPAAVLSVTALSFSLWIGGVVLMKQPSELRKDFTCMKNNPTALDAGAAAAAAARAPIDDKDVASGEAYGMVSAIAEKEFERAKTEEEAAGVLLHPAETLGAAFGRWARTPEFWVCNLAQSCVTVFSNFESFVPLLVSSLLAPSTSVSALCTALLPAGIVTSILLGGAFLEKRNSVTRAIVTCVMLSLTVAMLLVLYFFIVTVESAECLYVPTCS